MTRETGQIRFEPAWQGARALYPGLPTCAWPYKVESSSQSATGPTRVLIESCLGRERWSTIGVSQNIIEASCEALADSLELYLLRAQEKEGWGLSAQRPPA